MSQINDGKALTLLERYLNGECSHSEYLELIALLNMTEDDPGLHKALLSKWRYYQETERPRDNVELKAATIIERAKGLNIRSWRRRRKIRRRAFVAVATVVAVFAVAVFVRKNETGKKLSAMVLTPGGKHGFLRLNDGSVINLDTASGIIAVEGNTRIVNSGGGLTYYPHYVYFAQPQYNSVTTPGGGEFHITLPDGSKVWMNAASFISFPVSFQLDRIIELRGEAYFEVVKADKPFRVRVIKDNDTIEVKVLGTHFNISAYADDKTVTTTLCEGAVEMIAFNEKVKIVPGQQATLQSKQIVVTEADTSVATAWKDGMFHFKGASIYSVMQQFSRWYNMKVEYQADIKERFYGTISRNVSGSKLLEMLEKTGQVKFRVVDNTVIVHD